MGPRKASRRRRFRSSQLEVLEPRTVLAADLVISEIMASNGSTLLDEDQSASDWLEIHNRTEEPVDLRGWFLTDDRRDLTKWSFPELTLNPNEYRVVFASGKDRAAAEGNLHTNFRLNREGEYLALVRPDGRTIEDALDPTYPEQPRDVSYGRGEASITTRVVDPESSYQYLIPSDGRDDPRIGGVPGWARPDFEPQGWSEGRAGFGFETESSDALIITPFSVTLDGAGSTFAGAPRNLINQQNPFLSPLPISAGTRHSSVSENNGSWLSVGPATLSFDLVFPATFDHLLLWNYSFFDPVAGVDKHQDQGTREFAVSFSTDGTAYSAEQFFTMAPPVQGELVPVEQFFVGAQTARFVRLRQISSYGGLFGLGEVALARGRLIDPDLLYDEDFVTTDLRSAMHDAGRTSAYVRTAFDLANPEAVTGMKLAMQFDDGFVAYLNGVEVARANAPESLAWNAAATDVRSDRSAVEFLEFDISEHRGILRPTNNVLAVHGLNAVADGMDFLLHPRLEIVGADPVPFGLLETPTPGQANARRVGAPVQFSRSGGLLAEPATVVLSVDNPADEIYFTLDGSEPGLTSPRYTGPLSVTESTVIKARSFTPAGTPGVVRQESFVKLAEDLRQFDSNLPIFIVDTHGGRISASRRLQSSLSVVFDVDSNTGRASTTDDPHYAGPSGLRQRGRSSASFPKKQYKYETWDQHGNDAAFPLLGLPAEADWVLHGPYTDKSLMRNVVSYKWWGDLGYYSPRTRFIELFLNDDGDGEISFTDDYAGIYVLIESIERGSNRVDVQPPEPTTNIDEITGGYVIEVGNPGQFSTRGSGQSVGYQFEDPGPNDLNAAQKAWIKRRFEDFEAALYSPDFTHPETGKHYSEYIDIPSFVDYRILREFTRNFDGGSTYVHIDRGGKLTMGPLWDLNWALGNVNYAEPTTVDRCGCDIKGWNYSYTTPTISAWPPWSVRLQEDPEHWQLIVDRWHELRKTVLKDEQVLADIDANYQLLRAEAADRNFEKWPTLGRQTVISPPGFRQRDTYEKEVNYLRDWLTQHAAWLDQQFVPAPTFSHSGGTVSAGSALEMDSAPAPPGRKLVQQGDPARVKIAADDSLGSSWTQTDFVPDDSWIAGTTGIGFDNSRGYRSIIGQDVGALMRSSRSALIRMEFEWDATPDSLQALILQMRYDDGFVAYLNGTEIARSESVLNATPGSARARTHEAYEFESFDVSAFGNLLRRGTNVLAVHGINASPQSTDFVVVAELVAVATTDVPSKLPIYYTTDGSDPRLPGGQINPRAQVYAGPLRLNESTRINARALQGSTWSALESAVFLVGTIPASAASLRISEVHYNPADAAPAAGELQVDNDEFEFLELLNISQQTLNLENVRFTEVTVDGANHGIDFTFPPMALGPGERTVVVANREAFRSRYGTELSIAGQFSKQLANGGETITLLAADGQVIQVFRYNDAAPWPVSPDGSGTSLQVIDPHGDYNTPRNWRSGGPRHGTPGRAAPAPGDANLDGIFDSRDLVQVFRAGTYEDQVARNADWASGDWNGDLEFNSSDLVLALQQGAYTADALAALTPASLSDIASALAGKRRAFVS